MDTFPESYSDLGYEPAPQYAVEQPPSLGYEPAAAPSPHASLVQPHYYQSPAPVAPALGYHLAPPVGPSWSPPAVFPHHHHHPHAPQRGLGQLGENTVVGPLGWVAVGVALVLWFGGRRDGGR